MELDRETFGFSTGYKVLLWVGFAFFLAMAAFGVALPWLEPDKPGSTWSRLFGIAVFVGFAGLCLWVLRYMPEKIHVDDHGITHEDRRGTLKTLAWDDIAAIRERPFHQRLELHGHDGVTVIRIENQISGFARLRDVVLRRTDWLALSGGPEQRSDLPLGFHKPKVAAVLGWVGFLFFLGMAGLWAWLGSWILATPFILAGAGCALADWRVIRVEPDALRILYPHRTVTVPAEAIASVEMGLLHHQGNAVPQVIMKLRNGKRRVLQAPREGSLALYGALLLMLAGNEDDDYDE